MVSVIDPTAGKDCSSYTGGRSVPKPLSRRKCGLERFHRMAARTRAERRVGLFMKEVVKERLTSYFREEAKCVEFVDTQRLRFVRQQKLAAARALPAVPPKLAITVGFEHEDVVELDIKPPTRRRKMIVPELEQATPVPIAKVSEPKVRRKTLPKAKPFRAGPEQEAVVHSVEAGSDEPGHVFGLDGVCWCRHCTVRHGQAADFRAGASQAAQAGLERRRRARQAAQAGRPTQGASW